MRSLLTLVLAVSVAARAQSVMPEPSVPPPPPEVEAPVSAATTLFAAQALRVDSKNRISDGAHLEVSHRELFSRLGREDLLALSDQALVRRKIFIASSIAVLVASAVTGAIILATGPNLASAYCSSDIHIYNDLCVPRAREHTTAGTATILGGVAGALLLATLAWWSDPDLMDRDATSKLVSTYNVMLAKKLRTPNNVKFLPMISSDGAMLAASLRF